MTEKNERTWITWGQSRAGKNGLGEQKRGWMVRMDAPREDFVGQKIT